VGAADREFADQRAGLGAPGVEQDLLADLHGEGGISGGVELVAAEAGGFGEGAGMGEFDEVFAAGRRGVGAAVRPFAGPVDEVTGPEECGGEVVRGVGEIEAAGEADADGRGRWCRR